MKKRRTVRLLLAFITLQILPIAFPSIGFSSETGNTLTGAAKEMTADVAVFDSDTKKPLWGSHVTMRYHKKMNASERQLSDEKFECEGQVDAVTNQEGKINLALTVENCPTRAIEREVLLIIVKERGYAAYRKKIKSGKVTVALERLGYKESYPPLKIDYPDYVVDRDKYKNNFDLLNEMNKHTIGDSLPTKSYFAWKYSRLEALGQEGYNNFLEKIAFASNINEISLLKEVLNKEYPLPYKRIKFKEEESWRASDYIYDIGREAVAKALLNIADDRADRLLAASTDIPEAYLQILDRFGVKLSREDYWDYLSGKYVSVALDPMTGHSPRPDPLIFVTSKLKEQIDPSRYPDCMYRTFQVAHANNAGEIAKEHYKWHIDQDRLAEELFELGSDAFTEEVKRLLPGMEANGMTRKYLMYLYKQREYDYLGASLKDKKNLMKAFLAEDVKETSSWNTTTKEVRDLGLEECLITKMPEVTEKVKKEIEAYLKDASVNYTFYRWWIRNLAYVNRDAADTAAKNIYSKSQVEPYQSGYMNAKRYALRGAAEGKLSGLCQDVYADLQVKDKLKNDYFSVAQARIYYLSAACPAEFNRILSDFNVASVNELAKENTFEPSYAYDYEQKEYRGSIWQGVEKYFPEEKAVEILGRYICGNDEVIHGSYFGSNTFPEKYPIKCLCERFEKDLPTLDKAAASGFVTHVNYLDKCYPEQKQKHWRMRMTDWDQKITDRTYRGFMNIVKGQERIDSPTPIFDEKFKAFFTGTASTAEKLKDTMIDWSSGIESGKAFPLLQQALDSQDGALVQAALYAYSFYPSQYTPDIIRKLNYYESQRIYPDYLYAAYSLAKHDPAGEGSRSACVRSSAYHIDIIENRASSRYDQSFAFNALVTLDLCARVKDEGQYRKILNAIFERDSMGRYESFQKDLEEIILSNSIKVDKLLEKLFNSTDAIDSILGIRVAELIKYKLDSVQLEKMLNKDDAYVRLAAANYIKANKEHYQVLYTNMKKNTNKKVRSLVAG